MVHCCFRGRDDTLLFMKEATLSYLPIYIQTIHPQLNYNQKNLRPETMIVEPIIYKGLVLPTEGR